MQVGFIGIGVMGRPMTLNLLKAEHHVTIYARHPDKPEVQEVLNAGARLAATSNVLEGASKYAFASSWLIPRCLITRLVLLWSDSRSPGCFSSRGSHSRRRHVQVEAEQAKCLENDVVRSILVTIPNIATHRVWTDENAISELEIVFPGSATVAQLTRGEKPIHFQQHASPQRYFTF